MVEHLSRVQRVVDGQLEFGSPQDPNDPQSATAPNGVAHNGTLQNLHGSWFTCSITAAGRSTFTCIHNLFESNFTPTAGLVPVRWMEWGWSHDGTGGGAGTQLDLDVWYMGGAIAFDRIDLAVSAIVTAGALTISGAHPVRLDLFFIRAVR